MRFKESDAFDGMADGECEEEEAEFAVYATEGGVGVGGQPVDGCGKGTDHGQQSPEGEPFGDRRF